MSENAKIWEVKIILVFAYLKHLMAIASTRNSKLNNFQLPVMRFCLWAKALHSNRPFTLSVKMAFFGENDKLKFNIELVTTRVCYAWHDHVT